MNVFKSMSKIVLLEASTTVCLSFLYIIYKYQVDPAIVAGIFGGFIGSVTTYYFSKSSGPSTTNTP